MEYRAIKPLKQRKKDFRETNALAISFMNILEPLKAIQEVEGKTWGEL